eukprot:TRINITY_DN1018_c1_g1_i11.p1 TRINITY_DN1018_c1_g1~~TRINITY_DN1018_c1_g1_i11.p1  ORF type:complete len:132 (-),score=21.10 TRINITY_DN1018_c1_g1_i11:186-560(-)
MYSIAGSLTRNTQLRHLSDDACHTLLQAAGQSIPLSLSLIVGVGAIFTLHRWTVGDVKELVEKNQQATTQRLGDVKELVEKNQQATTQRLDRLEYEIKEMQTQTTDRLDKINARLDLLFAKKTE